MCRRDRRKTRPKESVDGATETARMYKHTIVNEKQKIDDCTNLY